MKRDAVREFKKTLEQGKSVFGPLLGVGNDPEPTVSALKEAGFDFFMVDLEHSLVNRETIDVYIRLSREYEMPILLRPEHNTAPIAPFLDAGIQGLMIPQVDTVAQARSIVEQACFAPVGRRGWGLGMSPYVLDGMDNTTTPLASMLEYVNRNLLIFPQTESLAAVRNLPHTMRLEGVTGTIVGTNDLALDIGDYKPDMVRSVVTSRPFIEERLREVVAACRDAGKIAGIGGFGPEGYAKWSREGYQFFTFGYVRDNGVQRIVANLKKTKDLIG